MRILTFEDIVQKRFPAKRAVTGEDLLQVATRKVSEHMNHMYQKKLIRGAMFFGSVARGGAHPLSDIDIFIDAYDCSTQVYRADMHQLQSTIADTYVPLEVIAICDQTYRSGQHAVTPHLQQHLRMCATYYSRTSCIIGDPLGRIEPYHLTAVTSAYQYVLGKKAKWEKLLNQGGIYSLSQENQYHVFAKALDFPVYAARMVLSAMGKDLSQDDSADSVIAVIQQDSPLHPMLTGSIEAKGRLMNTFMYESCVTVQEYDQWVWDVGLTALENAYIFAGMCLNVLDCVDNNRKFTV